MCPAFLNEFSPLVSFLLQTPENLLLPLLVKVHLTLRAWLRWLLLMLLLENASVVGMKTACLLTMT